MLKVEIERTSTDRYSVTYKGQVVCKNSTDPEHAACRYLKSIGCTGKVFTFWKGSDVPAMVIDINWGAAHCTVDAPTKGPATIKYRLFGSVEAKYGDLE